MLTKKVKTYDGNVNSGVNDEYPNPLHSFKQVFINSFLICLIENMKHLHRVIEYQ